VTDRKTAVTSYSQTSNLSLFGFMLGWSLCRTRILLLYKVCGWD